MNYDPLGIKANFRTIQLAWISHPQQVIEAQKELVASYWALSLNAWTALTAGEPAAAFSAKVAAGDERFIDPAWHDNFANSLVVQNYLTYTRWLERVIYDTPGVEKKESRTAAFWIRQWFNALAPSNFFLMNPVAGRKAWETGGASLIRGVENICSDINAGDLQMMGKSSLMVGKELANAPGSVIFRNDLMEVIQYASTSKKVHTIPIVFVPPWINKYYILDLNEQKSMIRFMVAEGFTVFVISWKNPGVQMAATSFENYIMDGLLKAIQVACDVCQVAQVHAAGYCIGGSALTTLMGWLNQKYKDKGQIPVAHWTLLSSLADFSKPGEIEAFINDAAVSHLEASMASLGYLDKTQLSATFRMLRPNSLIWHYYVHKYLFGETPPPLDILAWNDDSTRLARAMHAFCLREFYMENNLAKKNGIVLDGTPIDLAQITQPLYAVGTTEDHITPWKETFKIAQLVKGPVRYTLSTSGHILGIINPPSAISKRAYWVGDATGAADGLEWEAQQTKQAGSWWGDWTTWLHAHCGALKSAPKVGRSNYPTLCHAPGTYVLEK